MEHLGDHYHSKTFWGDAKSWYQRAMGAGNQSVRNSAGGKIARLFNDCDSHSLDILNWCLKAGRPGLGSEAYYNGCKQAQREYSDKCEFYR